MLYCSQEKEKDALLFIGEENRCTTVIRKRKLVHFCSEGEGKRSSTVFKRKNRCTSVFRRRKQVHYCYHSSFHLSVLVF